MPYFQTSQEWLQQSTLLFQAYPTSSRVTTKYTIHPAQPPNPRKRKRQADSNTAADTTAPQTDENAQSTPAAPKATLTLKTFDPISGVCLKYRTDKGAEVGRLIGSLGKLGKYMAARPDADTVEEPEAAIGGGGEAAAREEDVVGTAEGAGASQSKSGTGGAGAAGGGGGGAGGGGGGGGKKKKKGKK